MKCPKCRFLNLKEVKFCNECGNKLDHACPAVRKKINPLGSNFCNECGRRLREDFIVQRASLESEGERKHVSVLFSDLTGYTSMSENFDPEDTKEVISRIFGEIAQVVTKYEGFIEKFIGDEDNLR